MVRFAEHIKIKVFEPWLVFCIDYDSLKQKIKEIASTEPSSRSQLVDGDNVTTGAHSVSIVQSLLCKEIEMVNSFKKQQQRWLFQELNRLRKELKVFGKWEISGFTSLEDTREGLHKSYKELGSTVAKLLLYLELNVTGLRKILRKFDKYSKQQAGVTLLVTFTNDIQALCDTTTLEHIASIIEAGINQTTATPIRKKVMAESTSPIHKRARFSSVHSITGHSYFLRVLSMYILERYAVGRNCEAEKSSLHRKMPNYGSLEALHAEALRDPNTTNPAFATLWGSFVIATVRVNVNVLVPFLSLYFVTLQSIDQSLGTVSLLLTATALGNLLFRLIAACTIPNGMFLSYTMVISWFCLLADLLLWRGMVLDDTDELIKYTLLCLGCFILGLAWSMEILLRSSNVEKHFENLDGHSIAQLLGALLVSLGSAGCSAIVIHANLAVHNPPSLGWERVFTVIWCAVCAITASVIVVQWCSMDYEGISHESRTHRSSKVEKRRSQSVSQLNTQSEFQFGTFDYHAFGSLLSAAVFCFSVVLNPLLLTSIRANLTPKSAISVQPSLAHQYAHTSMWFFVLVLLGGACMHLVCALLSQIRPIRLRRLVAGIAFCAGILSTGIASLLVRENQNVNLILRSFTTIFAYTTMEWFQLLDPRDVVPKRVSFRARFSSAIGGVMGFLCSALVSFFLPASLTPTRHMLGTSRIPDTIVFVAVCCLAACALKLASISRPQTTYEAIYNSNNFPRCL